MDVQKKLTISLKLAVSVGLMVALFLLFDIRVGDLYENIKHWGWVTLAALMPLTLVPFFSTNRWRFLLRLKGIEETIPTLWRLNWIALFLGLFLPGSQGFDVFRVYFIERRHPDKRGLAGSTVVVERIIGLTMLGLLSLSALPFLHDIQSFGVILGTVLIGNCGILAGLVILFMVREDHLEKLCRPAWLQRSRVVNFLRKLYGGVRNFSFRQGLLPTVLLILAFQLTLISTVYMAFRAYGVVLPLTYHLVFYPLIGFLTILPITISGFGVREGLFVYFYSLAGVSPEVAVGVSLLNYLLVIGIPSLLGGLLLLFDCDRVAGGRPG